MKMKVTEITVGAFGLSKKFLCLTGFARGDYAQYKNVMQYAFIEKGKRSAFKRSIVGSPVLLLDGWREDVNPPSGMEKTDGGMRSRFATFAPEYAAEGKEFFQKLRDQGEKILLDSERGFVAPELVMAHATN